MKILTLLMIFLFILPFNSKGQDKRFYSGLGIEIGAGYNTATWKYDDFFQNKFNETFHRNKLWLKPTIRINYEFKLFRCGQHYSIKLKPFIGYYAFGGKSGSEPNGYRDIIIFRSFETGVIPTFDIREKFQVGVAFKGQYIVDVTSNHYGTFRQSDTIPRTWQEKDFSDYFKNYAISLGFNVRYKVHHFTFSGEGWFGLSNLSSINWAPYGKQKVTENNFRILIGYQL